MFMLMGGSLHGPKEELRWRVCHRPARKIGIEEVTPTKEEEQELGTTETGIDEVTSSWRPETGTE